MPPATAADLARQKQEAERQAVERFKAAISAKLDEMKEASPSEAENIHNMLKAQVKDPRLSMEFRNFVLKRARYFECNSNMRAATKAMNEAVDFARAEKTKERGARLAMGRQWYAKACALGADEEFRKATDRLIETAMMSGGVYKPGVATRAQPADTAPKNPHDAKAMPPEESEKEDAKDGKDAKAATEGAKTASVKPAAAHPRSSVAKATNWISSKF